MEKIYLNIFSIEIEIESNKEIAKWIKHDYNYYLVSKILDPKLKFILKQEKPNYENLPPLKATNYHDDYIVYNDKKTGIRIIDFFGEGIVIHIRKTKETKIISQNSGILYDIFYLSFESILGEELDKKGFHRIHCLALEKNNKATIILLPSGGGKTTLALKFLEDKNTNLGVLSEDMVLYKNKKFYGLHFRWGARLDIKSPYKKRLMKRNLGRGHTKILIDTKQLKLSQEANLKNIIIGKRTLSKNSKIKKISKKEAKKELFKNMVLGLELQQSLAYFFLSNTKDFLKKTKITLKRYKAMQEILNQSQTYEILLGRNIEKNYQELKEFIENE